MSSVIPLKTTLTSHLWKESEKLIPMHSHHQKSKSCFQPQKSSASMAMRLSSQHIAWLWVEMTTMYGQLFVSKNGLQDNGLWLDVLGHLTPKALESGIQRLKDLTGNGRFLDFPPNCLQFKAICMAYYDDLGLPKAHDVLREIGNFRHSLSHQWSHPLVEFIVNRLPSNFFFIADEQEAYALFKTLYKEVTDLIKQGHEIPTSKPRIKQAPTGATKVGECHLQQLFEKLRG